MLFTSIYGIVDGLCVSNFVGKTAFAVANLYHACAHGRVPWVYVGYRRQRQA